MYFLITRLTVRGMDFRPYACSRIPFGHAPVRNASLNNVQEKRVMKNKPAKKVTVHDLETVMGGAAPSQAPASGEESTRLLFIEAAKYRAQIEY